MYQSGKAKNPFLRFWDCSESRYPHMEETLNDGDTSPRGQTIPITPKVHQ